ncbi:MAG TPA: MBL fold metallo-hydrolase [Candidatus Thermoplasmatota archaeon]|nr:MBL fold metallo-hydrolase [Candidatus Thermoplasmatota archaeon]
MKLTVLGNAGRYLAPLAGGSSYLLEAAGARVLLDAGQGARAALAARDVEPLDGVWISHMHFDHVLDLPTLGGGLDDDARIHLPRGERRRLDDLANAYAWDGPFEMQGGVVEVEEGEKVSVRGIRMTFARTQHSAPAMAARFEADGRALVYASDTAPCDALRALARDADLLLMHTLLPTVEPESEHARIHSTAATAGALAAEVGARRLLLSHRYHESADGAMREAAASRFGAVELARDGETYEL